MSTNSTNFDTNKIHQNQHNLIHNHYPTRISTTTHKSHPKWRRKLIPPNRNNTTSEGVDKFNRIANNVLESTHISRIGHVEKAITETNDNDKKLQKASTIATTKTTKLTYLQVATALENTLPQVPSLSTVNCTRNTEIVSSIQDNSAPPVIGFERPPRFKHRHPSHPKPRIVYCKPARKSISNTFQQNTPNTTLFKTNYSHSLSPQYIDKLLNKPNAVLANITTKLQFSNNINYFSALFNEDCDEMSSNTMSDESNTVDLTITPTSGETNTEDNDRKPAGKIIIPQAIQFEPITKKHVNPKFTEVWNNIRKNAGHITKGTLLTLDQVINPTNTIIDQPPAVLANTNMIEQPWIIHTKTKIKQVKDDPYGNTTPNISPVCIPYPPKQAPTENIDLKHIQPVLVHILGPKSWMTNRVKRIPIFKINRILLSILHACQQQDPEARLGNVYQDVAIKDLTMESEIPTDEESEKNFIFDTKVRGNRFEGQILIKSNIPIHIMRESVVMNGWLAQEEMDFYKQHHSGVNYIDIGFFIKVLNRDPMDDHHTKTLRKWLPSTAPKFQLKSKLTSARSKEKGLVKSRVLFIMCTENDQSQLNQMISDLKNHTWQYTNITMYTMLPPEAKILLIEKHSHYQKAYFNFLIEGFKATSEGLKMNFIHPTVHHNNNIQLIEESNKQGEAMQQYEGEDETPPDISIEEFILNYWVDKKGNLLYRRIGPVVEDKRELTIHRDNEYQKDSLRDSLFGDLYHFMTADAANQCFNIATAIQQIEDNKNKSTPQSPSEFLADNNIIIEQKASDEKPMKRSRYDPKSSHDTVESPASILSTITYTSILQPDMVAKLSDDVKDMIFDTTKVMIADELQLNFQATMKESVTSIVDEQMHHQDKVLKMFQDKILAQEKSLLALEEKLTLNNDTTNQRLNILGNLVQQNQNTTRTSFQDTKTLMLNKFDEADMKADKKFDALMKAFTDNRLDTINSHHVPTLQSNVKSPSTAKTAITKTKPNLKHQYIVPQHYVAKNPYIKNYSPTLEPHTGQNMQGIEKDE